MIAPAEARELANTLRGFVEKEDRAALAALRRAVGKPIGEVNEPYRYLARWLASGNRYDEEACYLVASLFAIHRISWSGEGEGINIGTSFRRLSEESESESIEGRFVAMLNAHAEDFPTHLRHAVALLKSKERPIDWARLILDVEGWSREDRRVQRAWARSFWGESRAAPTEVAEKSPA